MEYWQQPQHKGRRCNVTKIFYLCDGKREKCKKTRCYKNGGECRHTTDINHALKFERKGSDKNGDFYEK